MSWSQAVADWPAAHMDGPAVVIVVNVVVNAVLMSCYCHGNVYVRSMLTSC